MAFILINFNKLQNFIQMKKTSLLLLLSGLIFWQCGSAPQPVTYHIKGKITGLENKKAYLASLDKNLQPVYLDTVVVKDSIFDFVVPKQNPGIAIISFEDAQTRIPLIIGDGNVDINVDKYSPFESDISNSTSQLTKKFFEYERHAIKDKRRGMILMQEYRLQRDEKKRDSMKNVFEQWQKNAEAYQYDYIDKNKDIVGLIVMQTILLSQEADYQKIRKSFESYPGNVKKSKLGKYVNTLILTKGATEIGGKAPNFIGTTPDGKKLSLTQAMGKVTIIDFWASWCRPCRMENPYVVEIYHKYHDQGLNIIGVSLDKNKEAWMRAIKDDGLQWQHVSSLKFWQEPIAKLYGVMSIPQTFIIDAKGIIRAKNLKRQELEKKIKELLEE